MAKPQKPISNPPAAVTQAGTPDENSNSNDDVIKTALERFSYCQEFWGPLYKDCLEDLKFSLGDQWPDELRRLRENDPDGARPCLTVDKLGQYVRQVVNNARQNKPSIKPRPVNDEADPDVAEILEGVIRHIENNSKADIGYDNAIEFAARSAVGFVRVGTDYIDQESFDQDIFIYPVFNPFQVYIEPNLSQDTDGAKCDYGFVFEDMPRKTFERTYPDADPVNFGEDTSIQATDWSTEETVRIAEYWSCTYEDETIWVGKGGASKKEIKGAKSRVIKKRKMTWRKISGKEVLEEQDWPSQYIGVIPCWGRLINVGGKYVLKSLISPAIDAQRMHNYSASSVMERACLSPKAKYLAAAAATENHEEQWRKANISNTPLLNWNHLDENGQPVPEPSMQPGPDVPQAWVQLLQSSEHDIQSALGMYSENLGEQSNAISGKAINARKSQGDLSCFDLVDNQTRMIRQVGKVVLDLFPVIYDTRRVLNVLAEDGDNESVTIDPQAKEPLSEIQEGQNIRKVFNPFIGKYGIVVTAGPSFATKRMEAVDWMTQMMQSNPAAASLLADLQVKAMDLPYADIAAKRFKAMLPPQIQALEQENGQEPIPPQVQQQLQQLHQATQQAQEIIQHLQQQNQQLEQQVKEKQTDAQIKVGDLHVKAHAEDNKKLETLAKMHESVDHIKIDWYQAETARIVAETGRIVALANAMTPQETGPLAAQVTQESVNQDTEGNAP